MQKRARPTLPLHLTPMPLPADAAVRAIPFELADDRIEDLHRHDVLEVGFCHSGGGVFLVEDQVHRFHAGCAVVVNRAEFHRARSDPGSSSRWTFCFLDARRLVGAAGDARAMLDDDRLAGRDFPHLFEPARHPAVCDLARLFADEAAGRRDAGVLRGLGLALMASLHRARGRAPAPAPRDQRAMRAISPALAEIGARPDVALPIPRLAARCRLSASAFRRAFRLAMGVSPKQYAIRLRVERAAALIRGGSSVLDAALDCGFASPSSLNRHCRAVLGRSPSRLRG